MLLQSRTGVLDQGLHCAAGWSRLARQAHRQLGATGGRGENQCHSSSKRVDENRYIFMATSFGTVKKTPLSEFSRPRASGIIAVGLDEDDYLIDVALT